MADFTKHRKATMDFTTAFASALASGDALSSIASITVTHPTGTGYADVSSEFGSPSGAISGTDVNYTLSAASSGQQGARVYHVHILVDTTNGERLSDVASLEVVDTGDPDAP